MSEMSEIKLVKGKKYNCIRSIRKASYFLNGTREESDAYEMAY
jgi:hypothetical protein